MSDSTFPRLDVTAQWGRLNESIIALVDIIPEDKLDWSPREELWNFRGILAHTVMTRDGWLGEGAQDGEPPRDPPKGALAKSDIQSELRRSWERTQRFLSDGANLDTVYERERGGETHKFSGHWMAFHLLEHDIHHRADIFHYLALLGIEHPQIGTP